MPTNFNPKSQSVLAAVPHHPRRSNPRYGSNNASAANTQQLSPGEELPRLGRSRSAQPAGPSAVPPLPPRPLTPQPPLVSSYQDDHVQFGSSPISFPEPQPYYGSLSQTYGDVQSQYLSPPITDSGNLRQPRHRSTQSDEFLFYDQEIIPQNNLDTSAQFYEKPLPPVVDHSEWTSSSDFAQGELSQQTLEQDGIRRFQEGTLPPKDSEWDRLVPKGAISTLPKKEVERQSVFFEIVKSEREYVTDLGLMEDELTSHADPPVIKPPERLQQFVIDGFQDFSRIRSLHQRILPLMFQRQKEQHPIITSMTDIILDVALAVPETYEDYMKNYPVAESIVRKELKRNPAFAAFADKCGDDPRVKRRDVITFISRPVTRLPRFRLIVEHIIKLTPPDAHDRESLELAHSILSDFVKSTEPGVEVANSRVKLYSLCDSLEFQKGEIIDLDLHAEHRALVRLGEVARRNRSEVDWHGWSDITLALLDNYLVMTKPYTIGEKTTHTVISRPIHVSFLRLGPFGGAVEERRDEGISGLFDKLRGTARPFYPFILFHANNLVRQYTFYAPSEAMRSNWKSAFEEALSLHRVDSEANKWFADETLSDEFFRGKTAKVGRSSNEFSGRIVAATTFFDGGRSYVLVACEGGVYGSLRGSTKFQKVLNFTNVTSMATLQQYNQFILLADGKLRTYVLHTFASMIQQQPTTSQLGTSMELLSEPNDVVSYFAAGPMSGGTLVVYLVKGCSDGLRVLEVSDTHSGAFVRMPGDVTYVYRRFPKSYYIPRDAFNITMLQKVLAISTEKTIVVIQPSTSESSAITTVPDFSRAGDVPRASALKARCEASRPLGLVQAGEGELLVVYAHLGCYITKRGEPTRKAGYLRWEIIATSMAFRPPHIILFSQNFIEIRHAPTGILVQVIQGNDIRNLKTDAEDKGGSLVAMRGSKDDASGRSYKLLELQETVPLTATPSRQSEDVWDEWNY